MRAIVARVTALRLLCTDIGFLASIASRGTVPERRIRRASV
jgi:hypothetical protein